MMRITGAGTALAVLVPALVLAGCAKHELARTDSTAVAQADGAGAPAMHGSFDPATHVVVVHAKDFAFEVPDTITAGWTAFHLVNDGATLHHVQLVRLESGKTLTDLSQALAKPGAPMPWASFVGGPNAVSPHAAGDATVDLQPGSYALVCFVDLGDHVPHFAKGMIHPLTVLPASGTAMAEPTADLTIDMSDYTFSNPPSIKAGTHLIKLANKGTQDHELILVKLAPDKTRTDLVAWFDGQDGPPPGSAVGGMSGITRGAAGYITETLTPGRYVLVCLVPDAKDGKPHIAHGMVKELTVD